MDIGETQTLEKATQYADIVLKWIHERNEVATIFGRNSPQRIYPPTPEGMPSKKPATPKGGEKEQAPTGYRCPVFAIPF